MTPWDHLTLPLPSLLILYLCATAQPLLASPYGGPGGGPTFPGRSSSSSDRLRKGNCTECKQMLELEVAQKLPRLMLIRQRILSAVGRVSDTQPQAPKSLDLKVPPTTPEPPKREFFKYKHISPAEVPEDDHGDVVLKFSADASGLRGNEEPVGASLLLFVDRRRKIKKGGKGKKIFLQISKRDAGNETWSALTYLRTRVKKRRLKKISLPVSVAQQLLNKVDSNSLDLKVKCIGCGRLVQLVIHKDNSGGRGRHYNSKNRTDNSKRRRGPDRARRKSPNYKRHSDDGEKRKKKKSKGQKHVSRRKNNPSATPTPQLIIRTIYRL